MNTELMIAFLRERGAVVGTGTAVRELLEMMEAATRAVGHGSNYVERSHVAFTKDPVVSFLKGHGA